MNPFKLHTIVERLKGDEEASFDVMDLEELGIEGILSHAGIHVMVEEDEVLVLRKDLLELAEMTQNAEISRLTSAFENMIPALAATR